MARSLVANAKADYGAAGDGKADPAVLREMLDTLPTALLHRLGPLRFAGAAPANTAGVTDLRLYRVITDGLEGIRIQCGK